MALPYATSADDPAPLGALTGVYPVNIRTDASAVSWGDIGAGNAATAALSLILLMLGTGLGLSSGFLAWAVASLATAALLTSVIGAIVSGGIQAGASVAMWLFISLLVGAFVASLAATYGGRRRGI